MIARLEAVTVRRHGRLHLAEVDLDATGGTSTAVVGGDGAGKTTLLRVLVGTIAPTTGRVAAPSRDRIGHVAAGSGTWPDLTVVENLAFSGTAYGLRGSRLHHRVDELLEATDLAEARDRLASRLSGGMRQKLAFGCASLHQPRLLVLDEPTTGVDPVSRSELWRLVSASLVAGAAVVFSTTHLDEATRADQVVVLDAGRPVAVRAPDELRWEDMP